MSKPLFPLGRASAVAAATGSCPRREGDGSDQSAAPTPKGSFAAAAAASPLRPAQHGDSEAEETDQSFNATSEMPPEQGSSTS